ADAVFWRESNGISSDRIGGCAGDCSNDAGRIQTRAQKTAQGYVAKQLRFYAGGKPGPGFLCELRFITAGLSSACREGEVPVLFYPKPAFVEDRIVSRRKLDNSFKKCKWIRHPEER